MTTWYEVSSAVESIWGGERPNDTMLVVQLELAGGSRTQQVFLRHELLPPDLEFVHVESPIGVTSRIDLPAALLRAGSWSSEGSVTFRARATGS